MSPLVYITLGVLLVPAAVVVARVTLALLRGVSVGSAFIATKFTPETSSFVRAQSGAAVAAADRVYVVAFKRWAFIVSVGLSHEKTKLIQRAINSTLDPEDALDQEDLAEAGRKLASEREDLIAGGIDPSLLAIPNHAGAEFAMIREQGDPNPTRCARLVYSKAGGCWVRCVRKVGAGRLRACSFAHEPFNELPEEDRP